MASTTRPTCDGDGRLRNWWTDDDRKAFEDRTHALIAQYNELAPSVCPEVHVNGELTIGENIGDLGGLSIAYQAWLLSLGGVEPAPQDGYTAAQRLFLAKISGVAEHHQARADAPIAGR